MTDRDIPPEVTAYLSAVSAALSDLPHEERDDLLAEVESSLVEAAGETDAPIAARLGPPEEFAAELRMAAGLHMTEPAPSPRASRIRDWMSALTKHPRVVALQPTLERLAPIWWLLRGYIAVAALALALDAPWSFSYPPVPRFGSGSLGLALIVAAAAVSVWLGLRGPRTQLSLLANVALVLAAVPVAAHLSNRPPPQLYIQYVAVASVSYPGLTYNGAPVRNIYPVTRGGRLLHDVLLYNEYGTPLEIGRNEVDPAKRVVITNQAEQVFNAFPIRYFEPGTHRVAHPNAMPRVQVPRIATPPLAPRSS